MYKQVIKIDKDVLQKSNGKREITNQHVQIFKRDEVKYGHVGCEFGWCLFLSLAILLKCENCLEWYKSSAMLLFPGLF